MNWVWNNLDLIGELTLEHIRLSIPPILLGFFISIPLGFLAYRFKLTRGLLLTVAGLLYTIPSLALFVLLPTLLSVLTTHVPERSRGAATSVFTTIAYLGFLTGPVYFGYWSEATGLPGAMLALAGLAAALAALTPLARWRPSAASAGGGAANREPAQALAHTPGDDRRQPDRVREG